MSDFNPALPRPIKWSVGENRYDSTGKQPRSISLFVPLESVDALHDYVTAVAADPSKVKMGKVWDYEQQAEVQVEGIYINGKGRTSPSGDYGTMNPAAMAAPAAPAATDEEVPF